MDQRVLLVDDDAMALRLLQHHLESAGYEVTTVDNAADALTYVRAEAPPILITDWMMPEMDGLELCRTLRADEGVKFVYIILLTAHTEDDRLVEAFDAGVDDYLSKPFNRKELIARLRAAQRIVQLQIDLDRHTRELHLYNAKMAVTSRQLRSANAKLTEMATTDELTGLLNRREAMTRLAEHWSVASRYREPFSCIMLDIDHFKSFNDTHGHAVGDLVLKEIATTLRSTARTGEAVCRIGGEEFLILCPQSTVGMASTGGERLRRAVETKTIPYGQTDLSVTISIGVAERRGSMETPDDLLKAADEGLYAAKDAGRNALCFLGPDDPEPIRLTAPNVPRTEPEPVPLRPPAPTDTTCVESVVIADDDASRRRACRRMLEKAGYQVTEAENVPETLASVNRSLPNHILIATTLSNSSALKCTRQLKADPRTRDIPVILLTDDADPDAVIEGLEAGADDYLTLPVQEHALLQRVRLTAWQRSDRSALLVDNELRGEQARAMAVLLDFSHQVAVGNNLDVLLDNTIKATAELTCSGRISIMLADEDQKTLTIARSLGIDEALAADVRVPVGTATSGRVFQSRRSVIINSEQEAEGYDLDCDCPIFASVPMISTALTVSEYMVGVLNITERQGARPFSPWDLECINLLANIAAAAIHGIRTRGALDDARDSIVVALAQLAEHRDADTGKHLDRVTRFAVMLAEALRTSERYRDQVDDDYLHHLEMAVPLHDIGKVAIPDRVLLKPGKLTTEEFEIMQTHAEIGAETIRSVIERSSETLFLRTAEEIALGHHEWYNGEGYPRGVGGGAIPLSARIVALADVYDAITSKRIYKEAMSHEEAVSLITASKGEQFDPDVVEAFIYRRNDFQHLAAELADSPEEMIRKKRALEVTVAAPEPAMAI